VWRELTKLLAFRNTLAWASLLALVSLVILAMPDWLERSSVNIESQLQEQAARAIAQNSVRYFLDQHSHDTRLWRWLNSDTIDMYFFLGIGKELNVNERARLNPDRQLIIRYYEIADHVSKKERWPPVLTKLDQLRLSVGSRPEESPDSIAAVKATLVQSSPPQLLEPIS
jgi:hypothetical protein